jgi:hypothetical protein
MILNVAVVAEFKVLCPNLRAGTQESHETTQREELGSVYIRKEQFPKACKMHCLLHQLGQWSLPREANSLSAGLEMLTPL